MLTVPRNIGYDDLASFFESLLREDAKVVSIPASLLDGGRFGMAGLLIQWLAAWSRANPQRTLKVSGLPVETVLSRLAEEPHGCAALYFSSGVVGARGYAAGPSEARRFLLPSLKAMQTSRFRDTNGSRGVHLCCYQGAVNEYLLPLYSQRTGDSLRETDGFLALTRQLLDSFEPLALRVMSAEQLEYVATLIEELFSNTHDHARFDEQGLTYDSGNIRGIFARTFEYRARASDFGDDLGPLGRYLAWASSHRKTYKRPAEESAKGLAGRSVREGGTDSVSTRATRFLEITVYDAGPGLARRWAAQHVANGDTRQLSIEEEASYVSACFQTHATTKRSRGFGQGLTSSLEALKALDAFMSLRTGRLFLYQDFSKPGTSEFAPHHWHEKRPMLPDVPGASYTIAIPLSRAKK